ncbi:MAG: alkaline phosphatase family protein [Thermoplasmata archaeon]
MTDPDEAPPDRVPLGEGAELMTPHSRLGVPIPAYRGRSLANLASSLGTAFGRRGADLPPLPPLEPDLDPFHGRRPEGPVVVLLVDGLGWSALLGSADRVPQGPASRWLHRSRPLTSVFPTTTTIALTSLSTGAAPGQHGVVGHRVYLPRYGTVVEVLRMSPLGEPAAETLVGPDWSPSVLSAVPSLFRRGVPGVAISRDQFEGTGFTRLIYDGASFVGYFTGGDLAHSLVEVLSRPEPPALVFAYWDDLDLAQHLRGPRPHLIDLELERVDALLASVTRRLEPGLARRTTLLMTGDHGQVPMETERQFVVDREPALLAHLSRPPAGDRRAAYFAARPGHLSALREDLEGRVPPGGHLIDLPAAVEAGLFGPPPFHPELSERLGDLLLLLPSPGGMSYTLPGARPRRHPMRGAHGGLEAAEFLVPLVQGSLSELASEASGTAHLPQRPPSRTGP